MTNTVRFAVQVGDLTSSIWRVWTNRSDVYLAARDIAALQKVSFHESGIWRHAFTSQAADLIVTVSGDPRLLERWERPYTAPSWTLGYHVIVPASEVTLAQPVPRKGVVIRPVAAPGHATHFSLVWATADAAHRDQPPSFGIPAEVFRVFDLPNGDLVWLVTYEIKLTDEQLEQIAAAKRTVWAGWSRLNGAPPPPEARGGMYGHRPDGSRFVVDIGLVAGGDD